MVRLGRACVLVAATSFTVGCGRSSRWPRMVEGAQYEVSNPTQCPAQVYTATERNVTRRLIGRVPSGGRAVVTIPPRSDGTRVVAMALYQDGTDCDVEGRIRVRRLGS
jgi:hypothetical protein